MAKHRNGRTSSQRGGGKHGTDDGRGGGGRSGDHGTPQEVTGRRAERRIRNGSFRIGPFGGIHNDRGSNAPEWRDRIRGA